MLTLSQLEQIHTAIMEFCALDEKIYGPTTKVVFHLICHLKECILDYGPSHTFWLFGYERYNGDLGQINTNNRTPESTLMQKFLVNVELFDRVHDMKASQLPKPLRNVLERLVSTTSV